MKVEGFFPEDVDKLCRRIVFVFKGKPLSDRDTHVMRSAFGMQTALGYDFLSDAQAWRSWYGFLGSGIIDVDTLAKTLKWLIAWLHTTPSTYSDNSDLLPDAIRDVCDFKRHMQEQKLLWGFVVPLRTVLSEFISGFSVRNFGILNQWFSLMTHITLRDVDLKTELIDEYVRLEDDECGWTYSSSMVRSCRHIIDDWFANFAVETLIPQHGPGATASVKRGTGRIEKYRAMGSDARLMYYIGRLPDPYGTLFPPGFPSGLPLDRTSVLQCVPKSMNKNRTISMEPTTLQFYQHGFRACVDDYLRSHPVLRGRIDLHDQAASQHLAMLGSYDASYATIDLSSASDTITLELVKLLFRSSPLLRPLICLRSDRTLLPNGTKLRLNKYAPMGSDLCFITMCIILASACEQSVLETAGRTSRWNDYRVYGDDIVIRTEFVPSLLSLLRDMRFEVNSVKSYWEVDIHNFREACGGEYVDGYDVTPVRVSRRLGSLPRSDGSMPTVEAVSSYVSLANEAMRMGLLSLRQYVLYILRRDFAWYDKLPYFTKRYDDGSPSSKYVEQNPYTSVKANVSILTYDWCCTNFRVKCRTSRYQRLEYRVAGSKVSLATYPRANSDIEDLRYYEYWLTLPRRTVKYEAGVEILPEPVSGLLPTTQKWVEKWTSPSLGNCLLRGKQTP